uniref:Decaprenyl-phosphate N-acetylglucosaminephosphotransferase n=1 Tax=uncultured Nocardioidaceae bacterium TaxID=253824 RepID=A0A6J4L5F2_9ACTN|nr:MAG: Decaprenyl-phosphate N-acetylglucosaminephosphotransferase [uncultured Nocardioidaceae bacterium]
MREYLLVFTVAAVVTYLVGVLAREVASATGAVAGVRDRDVHAVPIPYFGGVAMLSGLAAAYLVAQQLPFLSRWGDLVFKDASAVLLGGLVICLVGVIDDIWELDALTKFFGQVAAATVVVWQGVQFYWIPQQSVFTLDPAQALILSVLFIVGTVNAVNFIDGLDGLAAGVVLIGAVTFFIFAFSLTVEAGLTRALSATLLTAALAGACLGFLPHNFFPARLFMGDSGSMLIGLVLAGSAMSLTGRYQSTAVFSEEAGARLGLLLLPLILPVAMLLVPFVDLLLAVIRRTRAGRSPFSPDKMHLHHRLLEIGHSHRRAVLVMYLLASLMSFGTVLLGLFAGWQSYVAVSLLAAVTLTAVFVLPRLNRSPM